MYAADLDYSMNFNGINVSLKSQLPNNTNKYTYHKRFNMFFIKGTPFITFPINMHHFYKDLAVDLFSVLQWLPNSERAENW